MPLKRRYRGLDRNLRARLFARCGGRCDVCGQPLAAAEMDAHHRKQRSLGGRDVLSNLLALHRLCHGKIHNTNSHKQGWLCKSTDIPSRVPVLLYDGYVLLNDGGGLAYVSVT